MMRINIARRAASRIKASSSFSSVASIPEVERSNESDPITIDNQFEHLEQAVTPLVRLEYSKQLEYKQNFTKSVVQSIYKRKPLPKFRTKISQIIPSPVTENYRNKDEFSVNTGVDGDPKTVGFYLGSPAKGEVICVPPIGLINMKKKHIEISQLYQEFIRVSSLRPCLLLHDGGFWRNLVVRSNNKGETMVSVVVHPDGASEEVTCETMQNLTEFFSGRDICSLYYQACPHTRCSNSVKPYKLLYGKKYLYEELGPYKFQISPDSFFQVNTKAAEVLYTKALELAEASDRSTLLDLCSGTGGISICASSEVRGCIGIETLEEAVKDSVANAKLNNVTNCHFIAGTVEKKLIKALKDLDCSPDIVTVLNPGRSGIMKSAIKALRNCPTIRTLIYISCKADNPFTMNNFVDLLNPNFDNTPPFILTEVQPVDMFPHTKHCELIMVFKR